jgi:hypothetical protein
VRENFELVDLDVEWRYLVPGMIQNGHGDVDNMVKCLKDEMWDSAEVLRRKKNSVAGAVYLVNTVLLPRALYRLKLSSASDEQIDQIQSALRKTIASKAHITAASSSILFGGYMGCGWKKWNDEVGIERLKIVQAAWQRKRPLCLQKLCVVQCGVHNQKAMLTI